MRPPLTSVRLPPALMVTDPSTVYVIPVQTCGVVTVQSPVMRTLTWSQVPARAAGLRATIAAKSPPRATDQTIKHVRALAFRSDRLDNPRPPEVESAERIRKTTTDGHVVGPIRGLFINRLPRDYLSRYAPVLTRKNDAGIWRETFYHVAKIEIGKNRRNRLEKWEKNGWTRGPRVRRRRPDHPTQITFFFMTFFTLTVAFFADLSSSDAIRWPQA